MHLEPWFNSTAVTAMTNLESATWGLVIATGLLFLVTAISSARAILDPRARRREVGARVIPDMHILSSRLDGETKRLLALERTGTREELKRHVELVTDELTMLSGVLAHAADAGLRFANELYICRHLLTQAMLALERAVRLEEEPTSSSEDVRERDALVQRATNLYAAARATLAAAERELPEWSRRIAGEEFWDRFSRVASEREQEAERNLLAARRESR